MGNMDEELAMILIHSLQVEAWCDSIVGGKHYKQEFKSRVNDLRKSSHLMNKYLQSFLEEDEYELSAQISDSLLKMTRLPSDKVEELTEIMTKFIDEYEPNN